MSTRRPRFVTALGFAIVCLPTIAAAQVAWPGGHVYLASTDDGLHDVTNGGSTSVRVANTRYSAGQIAWSRDGSVMYVTQYGDNSIAAVTPAGEVTTFATGLSGPTGLVMTREGRLLVACFNSGGVIDATAGGDLAAAPSITDVPTPRSMVQLASGRILVVSQSGSVYNLQYPAGTLTLFATVGGTTTDIVEDEAGRIFVSEYTGSRVVDITAGGSFAEDVAFASGHQFIGLTVDNSGRLLASAFGGHKIFDITEGGDFSQAPAYVTSLGLVESALDTAPVVPRAVATSTEPAGPNCAHGGVAIETCLDGNRNALCDASELSERVDYVCNGEPGAPGADVLVATTPLTGGDTNCPAGGTRIDAGLDNGDGGGTEGNGTLESGEIDTTVYACNGGSGSDGADGSNALVQTTPLPAGDATCPSGGVRISVGIDNGDGGGTAGNGILESGEVDSTSAICNGTNGANGDDGANGADGADGSDGGCAVGGDASGLLALLGCVPALRRRRRRVT